MCVLCYLGCQFVPVGIFVITQDGASQPKCHMNPHLMFHSYKHDKQHNWALKKNILYFISF